MPAATKRKPFQLVTYCSIVKTKRPVYVFSDGTTDHRITKPRDVWRCNCRGGKYTCDAMVTLFAMLRNQSDAELAAEHIRNTAILLRQDNTGPRWLR